jgi:hypothetical protein
MNKAKVTGIVLAIGAAAAFAMTPSISLAKDSKMVHCAGVNTCKGHSGCKGSDNKCKGQNTCKGKGWVKMSKQACDDIGGTVENS